MSSQVFEGQASLIRSGGHTKNLWTCATLPCPSIKSLIIISLCVESSYSKHYKDGRRTVRAVKGQKGPL